MKRSPVLGLLLTMFGFRMRGVGMTATGIAVIGRSSRKVPFADFEAVAMARPFLGFSMITFRFGTTGTVRIAGLKKRPAAELVSAVNAAWFGFLSDEFRAVEDELRAVSRATERLQKPRRYPSACVLDPYYRQAQSALQRLPKAMPDGALGPEQVSLFGAVAEFCRAPQQARTIGIKAFIEAELERRREFFDSIGTRPLTPEQRLAVITDEDATLVLAGAGAGKTTVIVAKAAHLIRYGIRAPSEILLLAFGKDAAAEMARRVGECSGASIDALTFHALGYAIIRSVEGTAPALASHATDDAELRAVLREILEDEVRNDPALARAVLRYFAEFFVPYKSEWDFATRDEYYRYVETHELRSLNGELVKSFEELEIANWLYLNGIEYEYEPVYEHDLPENDRRVYTPDFRLSESGVYIEHFGVRKTKGPDGSTVLTTAPFVDRDRYLADMRWKRTVHREQATTLIETFSYERVEGRLLESLWQKLSPWVTLSPIAPDQAFARLARLGQVDAFSQTVGTFLRHFKGSGAKIDQCRNRGIASEDPLRSAAFLLIFEHVFDAYQRRLDERIDFEDMILRAAEYVETGRYRSPYRHILVDEFQDISTGRARLLRALKAQHDDARLFAVGDDWQSIYRFTGSDISLMRGFGATFGGTFAGKTDVHTVEDLGRTFRSVDKIALPARRFVLRNPDQIEKRVVPAGTADAPAIRVAFHSADDEAATLYSVVDGISSNSADTQSVLVPARYHHQLP
ncbi:MAG: UvrD-helicase domain-containing protein, partial [bacterium]